MSEHLSAETVSAFVDGELAGDDLARAAQHVAECAACARRALSESLLERSTANAGHRYAMPEGFEARMQKAIAAQQNVPAEASHPSPAGRRAGWSHASLWGGALAAVLLVSTGGYVAHDLAMRNAHSSALVAETVDEHIAALAAATPQVISTDRHTVKPWFQGKLPFSFNLPAALPQDVTLDGANLVQLEGQPTAQLLFSIGKHHASVFLRERDAVKSAGEASTIQYAERNGFHVEGFRSSAIDGLAVSDADPARLHDLALALEQAQAAE